MTHLQPPVSIIMPVRNAAKTLERTIESIRNQSYANIMEIILAIGPSNDGTEFVGRHSKRDSRINIVETKVERLVV